MSIKSDTFYFAVCDRCGAEYQYEDETFLYDTADHLERAVRNDWTERDGKHYCNDCQPPDEPPPPSLPMFETLPGSDPRCETCGRILSCVGTCPKGCDR